MTSQKKQRYSQLLYRNSDPAKAPGGDAGSIIVLHGHMKPLDELLSISPHIAPDRRVEAPEAARGVYRATQVIGRTWFGGSLEKPEAASFGDSLAQLERFIYDVQGRSGESAPKPWILGYEQGAVLALTFALIAPDLISGVIAIDGGLPSFTNEHLLEPMEATLPILIIGNSDQQEQNHQIQSSATQLQQLGNRVTAQWMDTSISPDSPVMQVSRDFLNAHS